jgi:hypothetical protein
MMKAGATTKMSGAAGTGFVLPEYCTALLSKRGLQVAVKYLQVCELYQKNDFFKIAQSLHAHMEEVKPATASAKEEPRQLAKIKPTVAPGTMPAAVRTVAPAASKATQDNTDSRVYAGEYLSDEVKAVLASWFAAQASVAVKRQFRHVFRRLFFFDHPDDKRERPTTPTEDKPRFLS